MAKIIATCFLVLLFTAEEFGSKAADTIDLEELSGEKIACQGAGPVHHIAFAVDDRAKQLEVRKALMDTGYQVMPVIDCDYFWANP